MRLGHRLLAGPKAARAPCWWSPAAWGPSGGWSPAGGFPRHPRGGGVDAVRGSLRMPGKVAFRPGGLLPLNTESRNRSNLDDRCAARGASIMTHGSSMDQPAPAFVVVGENLRSSMASHNPFVFCRGGGPVFGKRVGCFIWSDYSSSALWWWFSGRKKNTKQGSTTIFILIPVSTKPKGKIRCGDSGTKFGGWQTATRNKMGCTRPSLSHASGHRRAGPTEQPERMTP